MENIFHALSDRMRTSSTRLARSLSSGSSSSSGGSVSPTSSGGASITVTMQCLGEEKPLKRLAFVRSQGSFWLTWMSMAYSTGRAMMPLPHSVINALETTMSDISSDFVSAASERSEKVLYALDAKVDSVISVASNVRENASSDVWERLAQQPPLKYAWTCYQKTHDVVVATPIYTKALEMGSDTMSRLHESRIYKSLLPLLGPLTEPTVKRIMDSPTFQAVKEHLAPMPPAEEGPRPVAAAV